MWWWHGDLGWGAWLAMSLGMVAFWALEIDEDEYRRRLDRLHASHGAGATPKAGEQ